MKFARIVIASRCVLALAGTAAMAEDVSGVTKDSIKIGVIGPMTGAAAVFDKSVFGVEAVFRDVNDHGGINGRRIEVVREDDGCDPARGIAALKKVMAQDRVFAVDGIACSGVAMALKPEVAKTAVNEADYDALTLESRPKDLSAIIAGFLGTTWS